MANEIRILIVEDSDAHHELVLRELKNAEIAFTSRRVQTEKEFVRELTDFHPTLILCDYMLPTFDGMSAFKLVQKIAPHTPFIIVTASMNEETAVACMKAGVADYVLKEHIGLLRAAVKSALERKDASEALKKSKAQLAEAEHMVKLGSWEWDWRTDEIYWSDEIYKIFDVPPGTKPSLEAFMEKLHPEDREIMASRIREIKEKGPQVAESSPTSEYRMITRTGEVHHVLSTSKTLKGEDGQVLKLIGTIQDITERKKLENQFQQSQKMEIVGNLAGGIAHDFNNVLTVISGYSDLILSTLAKDDSHYLDLQEIKKAAERAQGLTAQLLAFSRRESVRPQPTDLNEFLRGMESMLRRLIGEHIELKMTEAKELPTIMADPNQLQQVLLNLSVNARDAMAKGGVLTLETARETVTSAGASIDGKIPAGDYVLLSIRDTGYGMKEEVKKHLFEPFFTTKEKGKGTGLGLTICQSILKQMGCFVGVESAPGKGTCFKIYFPFATEGAIGGAAEARKKSAPKENGHTVLLVEDEAIVRSFSARVLRGLGYDVIEEGDGTEALDFLQTHKDKKVDILFTDIMMPKMNGKELAGRVHSLHPEIKVLFTSGYIEEDVVRQSVLDPTIAFIRKPFSPEALSDKLKAVLSEKKASGP